MRKKTIWISAALLSLLGVLIAISYFIDEPFRKYLEEQMNSRLKGYRISIQKIDIHLLRLSGDASGITIVQTANPSPPIAQIERMSSGLHWSKLLKAKIVTDVVIERPRLHLDLNKIQAETRGRFEEHAKSWQDAIASVSRFQINRLRIRNGEVTYIDTEGSKPLRLSAVRVDASNIRNIDSPENTYPSKVNLDATVFDTGRLSMNGNANFLQQPHLGFKAAVNLENMVLDYFSPLAERQNISIRGGTFSAKGNIEYSPARQIFVFEHVSLKKANVDYIDRSKKRKEKAEKLKQSARELAERPETLTKIKLLTIEQSTFGFVNRTVNPAYRVFMDRMDMTVENFSNHFSEGPAKMKLTGKFMGSGETTAEGTFRSEKEGPDFDLAVAIKNTSLPAMNRLFMAYGKFDIHQGHFSFFSEFHVKKNRVEGYVKPLFKDMKVYDKRQDEEKNLFKKLYEKIVDNVSKLLENPRDVVATETRVSGRLEEPQMNTWQAVINLIRNAFFRTILPGFEETIGK